MVVCPNCHDSMASRTFEGYGTRVSAPSVEIDVCTACGVFWFDKWESVRFTPKSVLELFRFIGNAGAPQRPLGTHLNCPRCASVLAATHDVQRHTRFTYWRCGECAGQLITFNQFLRQKNFVREPTPAELARLRATIRQINCSQCGAPIDLAADSACPHCGAPVALVDPDSVAKAVHELSQQGAIPAAADQEAMRTALSDAQINAIFELARMREPEQRSDLVSIGGAAIGALIDTFIRSR
jgi:hypothetical protein